MASSLSATWLEVANLIKPEGDLTPSKIYHPFLADMPKEHLKALQDAYGTLKGLLSHYVQEYQNDLSHDVFARDFFGESVIKASGLDDTLPHREEDEADDDYDEYPEEKDGYYFSDGFPEHDLLTDDQMLDSSASNVKWALSI